MTGTVGLGTIGDGGETGTAGRRDGGETGPAGGRKTLTWTTPLASHACEGSVGLQKVFVSGVSVAMLSMLKSAVKAGSTRPTRVNVTRPPGATVTCASISPEPDVGATVDPEVAVAVHDPPGVSPAGTASVIVP